MLCASIQQDGRSVYDSICRVTMNFEMQLVESGVKYILAFPNANLMCEGRQRCCPITHGYSVYFEQNNVAAKNKEV